MKSAENSPAVCLAGRWLTCLMALLCLTATLPAAEVRTFPFGRNQVVTEEVTQELQPQLRAMRFNEATGEWNVDLVLTNAGARSFILPAFAVIESVQNAGPVISPDGLSGATDPKPYLFIVESRSQVFRVLPGGLSAARTLRFGFLPGGQVPRLRIRVFGTGSGEAPLALALTRTLNEAGQPLTGVRVTETGPETTRSLTTDPVYGVVTLGQARGRHTWLFEAPGRLPVWRTAELSAGSVTLLHTPRLIQRGTSAPPVGPLGGTVFSTPTLRLEMPPGALSAPSTVVLTRFDGQTLPAPLPLGWSPLVGFWMETEARLNQPANMLWTAEAGLSAGVSPVLVRWNPELMQWVSTAFPSVPNAGPLSLQIPSAGAYAVVMPDSGPTAPASAVLGNALLPAPSLAGVTSLAAVGQVLPATRPPSREPEAVTATASLVISNAVGALPSGIRVRGQVDEDYTLKDGTRRHPPRYEQDLVAYQRPGDAIPQTVQAAFPMRPLFLFGAEELGNARVSMEVLTLDPYEGQVIRESGGFARVGAVTVRALPGAYSAPQAALIRLMEPAEFAELSLPGFVPALAFDLTVAETAPGARLQVEITGQGALRRFVLCRVLMRPGFAGLQPIQRMASNTNGVLVSSEPATGSRLPGVRGAGQYVLVEVPGEQRLLSGTVLQPGGGAGVGLVVKVDGLPWVTESGADGGYQLLASAGRATVVASDLIRGISDVAEVQVDDPAGQSAPPLSPVDRGPRVTQISPADHSERVSAVASVVVTFSEPIDAASLGASAIRILRPSGDVLAAALSLGLRGTVLTALPSEPLPTGELIKVVVDAGIRDRGGRALEGTREFSFTTQSSVSRGELAKLTIFQPGATNLVVDGRDVRTLIPAFSLVPNKRSLVIAYGSPGTADGRVPVVLVNETSGETSTVLSGADGSFAGFVPGAEEDFVSAVFVNANGTRTTVAATRQKFDDGREGLYAAGGILEAESDRGPIQVLVEPGIVETRSEFKVEPMALTELLTLVQGQQPLEAKLLGGFRYQESGGDLKGSIDVSFPVRIADLGLPQGVEPKDRGYALVVPAKFDGTVVYEVLDTMQFESDGAGKGRLVTHSPPFPGLLARALASVRENALRQDSLGMVKVSQVASGKQGVTVGMAVVGLDQPLTQGGKIAGHVRSARMNDKGQPQDPQQPVAGAVVVVDRAGAGRAPGFLKAGELVATSGRDGAFAFFLKPGVQGDPREVVASHPRFPFQAARVGVLLDDKQTSVARVDLIFPEARGVAGTPGSSAPAVIRASHFPVFPSSGTTDASATTLSLVAIDDIEVSRPSIQILAAETPDGRPLDPGSIVHVEEEAEGRASATTTVQRYRIRADVAAKVKLAATVFDDSGVETRLDYSLQFGFNIDTIPSDPEGHPSVLLAWPPDGSERVPSLSPIQIRFTRALPAELFLPGRPEWVTFDDKHRLLSMQPSSDRREVTFYYDGDKKADVRLTLSSAVDQDPATEKADSFTLKFSQAGQRSGSLDEGDSGGGVVMQGRFAFALDRRASGGGRLLSFDLKNPAEPEQVDAFSLDQRPTTLTLIPDYSLPTIKVNGDGVPESSGCEPSSMAAVFIGGSTELKRLRLIRMKEGSPGEFDPTSANLVLSRSESSTVVKSRWDPPFLGYLELGADVTSVTLLDLTAVHAAQTLSPADLARLPQKGDAGLDQNGDGDYCDAGDRLPSPIQDGVHPPGFSFSFAPTRPSERIQDFDHLSDIGLVAVVTAFSDGSESNRFRVVLSARVSGPLDEAAVLFPAGRVPKRVTLLRSVLLQTPKASLVRDLALVSLVNEVGGEGSLAILDITDPGQPKGLAEIPLPAGEGQPGSLVRRTDGLLALGTTRGMLVLDPTRLLMPSEGARHPAFVQSLDMAAGGVRDFASDPSGLHAVFQGGIKKVVQTEPNFQLLTFNRAPFRPENLLDLPVPLVQQILSKSRPVSVVEPAPVDANGEVVADVDPARHYYVLVDAPGGAGGDEGLLPIVVSAIQKGGAMYERNNRNPVPSVIGDRSVHNAIFLKQLLKLARSTSSALDTGENAGRSLSTTELLGSLFASKKARQLVPDFQAFARLWASFPPDFNARRLSDNPASTLYNRFLAGPFLVLPKAPEAGLVKLLKEQSDQRKMGRAYLRASPQLWVGLQKDFRDNEALGQFASVFTLGTTVTVAGQQLPILSGLGSQLLDFLTKDQDILGPVALEALQLLLKSTKNIPVLNAVGIDYHPRLLPGVSLLRPEVFTDRPMLFIPGFIGSRLNGPNGEVWPSILGLRQDETALQLTPAGNLFESQAAPDVLRHVIEAGPVKMISIYGAFIDFLKDDVGYQEYDYLNPKVEGDPTLKAQANRLRLHGSPNLSQDPAPDLFVFPYDWRQDNARAAQLLEEYVQIIRYYHPEADGIELMAHSNGNLVGRRYMLDHPGVVKRFVSLAAPFLGSGKPLVGMLSGDLDEMALNLAAPIPVLRRSMQFMPGAHQLIVNRGLFDLGVSPVEEMGVDVNRNGRAYERYHYPQFSEAMEKYLFRETHAELLFRGASPSRKNHEDFQLRNGRLEIGDWSRDDASVDVHHLISMQAVPRSPLGVRYVGRLHRSPKTIQNVSTELPSRTAQEGDLGPEFRGSIGDADGGLGVTTNQFRFSGDIEFMKSLGDGTVPILSLSRGFGSDLSLNAPHARLHCLVSQGPDDDESTGHVPMMDHARVHDWVRRILEGRKIQSLSLSATRVLRIGEGQQLDLGVTPSMEDGATGGAVTTLVDFGDGTSGARVAPLGQAVVLKHRYRQDGVRVVSYGSALDSGVSGFTSTVIEVTNIAPTVTLELERSTVRRNETMLVQARVRDPGVEDQHRFVWKLDGAALTGQSGYAVFVNFPSVGEHVLSVEVSDEDGGTGRAEVKVRVVLPGQPVSPPPALASLPDIEAGAKLFEAQPALKIRITGARPGPFDTKGIVITERGIPTFQRESLLLPLLPIPILQVYQEATSDSRLSRYLRRLKNALVDSVVQRTGSNTVTVEMFQALDSVQGAALRSTVEFAASGGPLEIELLYSQGGTAVQLDTWSTNASAGAEAVLDFQWQTQEGTPIFEPTLKVGGQVLRPGYEALGPKAADPLPPSVAALFNPATGNVHIEARDNASAASALELFLVQDSSGDGRLEDEVFYKLGTNVLAMARLPARKFSIVARDEAGNLSPLEPFVIQGATDYTFAGANYCDQVSSIASAVAAAVQAGLNKPAVQDLFLLDRSHLWVFEQGSGACLWKANRCEECNGNFIPGISDNDYQLFLPVRLDRTGDAANEAERREFLASGPYESETLRGDWYFKPPTPVDDQGAEVPAARASFWRYDIPETFLAAGREPSFFVPKAAPGKDLSLGFDLPLVPAEVISRSFTQAISEDESVKTLLKQTTYFPVRREHFIYGVLDLELPPEDGTDPIADGGCGRQLLLLKWALEGSFVSLPASMGVNVGTPSLDVVYRNLHEQGVPVAEGFEWGILQEFSALAGEVARDLHVLYGPSDARIPMHSAAGNDLEKELKKKLKKMGKAAIRGAAARLAGEADVNATLFSIDRAEYAHRGLQSFEDWILAVATSKQDVAVRVFGDFARQRPASEGPDLFDFLTAKKGTDQAFYDEIFNDPAGYRRFILGGLQFLHQVVQGPTQTAYTQYLEEALGKGSGQEHAQRTANISLMFNGKPPARDGLIQLRKGLPASTLTLAVGLANYGGTTLGAPSVRVQRKSPAPPPPALQGDPADGGSDLALPVTAPLSEGALDDDFEEKTVEIVLPASGAVERMQTVISSNQPNTEEQDVIEVDDDMIVESENIPLPVDGAELSPQLDVMIGDSFGRVLDDWKADPGHTLASPKRYLRVNDPLVVRVLNAVIPSSGNQLKIRFSIAEVPNSVGELALLPVPGRPGALATAPFTIGPATQTPFSDEVTLVVELLSGSTSVQKRTVMVDLAEFAAGGIHRFYRDVDRAVVLAGATRERFAITGDGQFDDAAALDPSRSMFHFIRAAGSGLPDFGEADILHLSAHGAKDGRLLGHPSSSGVIFDPQIPDNFQDAPERWGRDLEWAILATCNALNDEGANSGGNNWAQALRQRRHAHGLLGAFKPISLDLRSHFTQFWRSVGAGMPLTRAYRQAMTEGRINGERRPQSWAYLCYPTNELDSLNLMYPDTDGLQILFSDFADVSGQETTCEALGRATPPTPDDATRPTAGPPVSVPAPRRFHLAQPLRSLSGGQYQESQGDDYSRRRWGKDFDRQARTSLGPVEAQDLASERILGEMPFLTGKLRASAVASQVSRTLHPDGRMERWTNGFVVSFDLLSQGVAVWGDQIQATVVGDQVRSIAAVVHEAGELRPMPADASPLSASQAMSNAKSAIQDLPASAEIKEPNLVYIPETFLDPSADASKGVRVPAWHVRLSWSSSGGEADQSADVWVHAFDGTVRRASR